MKIIYQGIFFDKENSKKLIDNSTIILERIISDLHITFEFNPEKAFPTEIIGKSFEITVIKEGYSTENHGFQVIIPDEIRKYYKGAKIPHITVSVSENGKPVNTKNLDFKKIKSFTVTGIIGLFVNKVGFTTDINNFV